MSLEQLLSVTFSTTLCTILFFHFTYKNIVDRYSYKSFRQFDGDDRAKLILLTILGSMIGGFGALIVYNLIIYIVTNIGLLSLSAPALVVLMIGGYFGFTPLLSKAKLAVKYLREKPVKKQLTVEELEKLLEEAKEINQMSFEAMERTRV